VELLSDRLLASAADRDSRCRKTRVCEFVCVPVTYFDLDPTVFDCLVYPSLKISISHFDEMITSECATRANFISQKNAKDLAVQRTGIIDSHAILGGLHHHYGASGQA